ncbi:MAG TPA: hypothetical protein VM914_09005 [Pyrinomonadaceae bacterium]|jgi:hypothetical protein|nr:hypothetical protein [Pyrinomonadaceae bacterium]
MRTVVRLVMLSASLALLACAARAQPAAPPHPPKDEPCHTAGQRYFRAFADTTHRLHMTVEQVRAVALGAGKDYLRLCGGRGDDFTLHVRAAVASAEAARRCELKTWPLYSKRVEVADSATRGQKRRAYEAAREFLRLCRHFGNPSTSRASRRVEEYEKALRIEEAEKTLASLVPAARAAGAGETAPETYARIAEAYAVARFEPTLFHYYVRLGGRALVGRREEDIPAEVREARARFDAALDRVIDAYARALASCGGRESCRASKAEWKRLLGIYYAYRHEGRDEGLEETIARAFDAPMPKL